MATKTPQLPRQSLGDDIILERNTYTVSDMRNLIRKMNLKITDQRVRILQCLIKCGRHVTAQELYELVAKSDSTIGFATVYRFLKNLTENQLAQEVRVGHMPARYEIAPTSHHDHLTCTNCGMICEFENNSIEKLQIKVAEHFGFLLEHHVLELYGICPKCQSRK